MFYAANEPSELRIKIDDVRREGRGHNAHTAYKLTAVDQNDCELGHTWARFSLMRDAFAKMKELNADLPPLPRKRRATKSVFRKTVIAERQRLCEAFLNCAAASEVCRQSEPFSKLIEGGYRMDQAMSPVTRCRQCFTPGALQYLQEGRQSSFVTTSFSSRTSLIPTTASATTNGDDIETTPSESELHSIIDSNAGGFCGEIAEATSPLNTTMSPGDCGDIETPTSASELHSIIDSNVGGFCGETAEATSPLNKVAARMDSPIVRLDAGDSEDEAIQASTAGHDVIMDYEMIGVHRSASELHSIIDSNAGGFCGGTAEATSPLNTASTPPTPTEVHCSEADIASADLAEVQQNIEHLPVIGSEHLHGAVASLTPTEVHCSEADIASAGFAEAEQNIEHPHGTVAPQASAIGSSSFQDTNVDDSERTKLVETSVQLCNNACLGGLTGHMWAGHMGGLTGHLPWVFGWLAGWFAAVGDSIFYHKVRASTRTRVRVAVVFAGLVLVKFLRRRRSPSSEATSAHRIGNSASGKG